MTEISVPRRQIRASYDDSTVTMYQAYNPAIGGPAAAKGRFGVGFKRERMTWIKPSFRWMMYRCGWGLRPGQECVLAISITREGFEWALAHSAFAHYDRDLYADRDAWRASLAQPVRVQWDPERDLDFRPLDHRSIQIGLGGAAVARYCDEWIIGIEDVTGLAHRVHAAKDPALLPAERPYPVPAAIAARIGMGAAGAPALMKDVQP